MPSDISVEKGLGLGLGLSVRGSYSLQNRGKRLEIKALHLLEVFPVELRFLQPGSQSDFPASRGESGAVCKQKMTAKQPCYPPSTQAHVSLDMQIECTLQRGRKTIKSC